jgi:DNA-binding transcriptional MerR regulator
MNVNTYLRTKNLAEAVGISVTQVRNYEASGFLPVVERSPSGYRRYTQQHLVALKTARLLIQGYGWLATQRIMQSVHDGELAHALVLIDERHAELAKTRHQLEQTLAAVSVLTAQLPSATYTHSSQGLRVGEAARAVGVRVSALRFWEQQGLLLPGREATSRYRLFDERQLRRLRIVALLRQAHYDFGAIRTTLEELESGQPQRAVAAVEQRRSEVSGMSWRCIEAMAALYAYVNEYYGGLRTRDVS